MDVSRLHEYLHTYFRISLTNLGSLCNHLLDSLKIHSHSIYCFSGLSPFFCGADVMDPDQTQEAHGLLAVSACYPGKIIGRKYPMAW